MKNIAWLSLFLTLGIVTNVFAQVSEDKKENVAPVVETQQSDAVKDGENVVGSATGEEQKENAEPKKEVFLTPEAKAKQEIADINYSISFYTQRMELSLDQLDQAKKFSEEDKLKREALLKSIYMLREQSRELEQQSLDEFKGILNSEQLAVFEELRKEQKKYRDKYDVLAGNVQQQVEHERKIIEIDNKQREEEARKAEDKKEIEKENRRHKAKNIKRGRWDMFD